MTDGMSSTMAAAENKAYQPNLWDSNNPSTLGVPPPNSPADIAPYLGGTFDQFGHTEWVEGDVHETGFTTVFTPNFELPYSHAGQVHDIDFTSVRDGESATLPTYAAVTARSYHVGGVGVLLLDGAVRFVSDSIDRTTWRSLGTRGGNEVVGEF